MQMFEDSKEMQAKMETQSQQMGERSDKISGCLLERLSNLAEESGDPDTKVGVIMDDRINKIRLAKKGIFSSGFVGLWWWFFFFSVSLWPSGHSVENY